MISLVAIYFHIIYMSNITGPLVDFLSAARIFLRVVEGECARNLLGATLTSSDSCESCLGEMTVWSLSPIVSCGACVDLPTVSPGVVSSKTGKAALPADEPGRVTQIHS